MSEDFLNEVRLLVQDVCDPKAIEPKRINGRATTADQLFDYFRVGQKATNRFHIRLGSLSIFFVLQYGHPVAIA